MSYYIQENGRRFLAGMISGSGLKLDTMYIEYGPRASDKPGRRDTEYFDALEQAEGSGVLVQQVANAYVDDNCVVHFTCMVRLDDTRLNDNGDVRLGCVTLAHMDEHGPVFVCTFSLPVGTKLIQGAYTTVRCSIDMGLGK